MDLDDEELEATRNKFYKLQKENEKLKKEIEEKTTILLVGAKKVKQLEKEIEELKKENNEIWGHLPRLD